MDRKTQKLMTLNRIHYPNVDVSRKYIIKNEGERGTTNVEIAFKATQIGLNSYLQSSGNRMLHARKETFIITCSLQEIGCSMLFYRTKRRTNFTQR